METNSIVFIKYNTWVIDNISCSKWEKFYTTQTHFTNTFYPSLETFGFKYTAVIIIAQLVGIEHNCSPVISSQQYLPLIKCTQ